LFRVLVGPVLVLVLVLAGLVLVLVALILVLVLVLVGPVLVNITVNLSHIKITIKQPKLCCLSTFGSSELRSSKVVHGLILYDPIQTNPTEFPLISSSGK